MRRKHQHHRSTVDVLWHTLKRCGLEGREICFDCSSLKRAVVIVVAPSVHADPIGFHDLKQMIQE